MNTQSVVSFPEFMTVWLKCLAAIDVLIGTKGYDALTVKDICAQAGLPEKTIEIYFGGFEILLKMHDGVIMIDQAFKTRVGGLKPE